MKNKLICSGCKTENPFYAYTCIGCNAFLRARIPNIDFWSIFSKLIETPIRAAESIIQSDHKNFVSVLLFIASLKISINLWIINNAFSINEIISKHFIFSLIMGMISFTLAVILTSFLFSITSKYFKAQTRFRDNLSIYVYAFLPLVMTFTILTPVQIALFGAYWFTFNPSPLIIKELPSYIILMIEVLFFLWSILLLIVFNYTQLRNITLSVLLGILELIIIGGITMFGLYLFTLIG
ncbi:MAG: hypothetical protein RDU14_03665 [Melioribacteraceae bacterium]|nr:hypothetical protein [Melioribacteraceae bacterium]